MDTTKFVSKNNRNYDANWKPVNTLVIQNARLLSNAIYGSLKREVKRHEHEINNDDAKSCFQNPIWSYVTALHWDTNNTRIRHYEDAPRMLSKRHMYYRSAICMWRHIYTYTCIHTYINKYTETYTPTNIHTYTHT